VTRSNLSPRKPRRNELRPLRPDSVRQARFAAPRSDHGLRKGDGAENHVKPSAELHHENVSVIDNLTQDIPITNRELDVIETYLASLLDGILGEKSAMRTGPVETTPQKRDVR
jgi:hypothetical protein